VLAGLRADLDRAPAAVRDRLTPVLDGDGTPLYGWRAG
jgi:hypothetical protein